MAKRPARKQSFITKADRPELKLKSDTPINSLTIRDLVSILGRLGTGALRSEVRSPAIA